MSKNICLDFRVKIQKVLPADTVAVYKCDFGDMNLLSVDSLKPLGPEFRKIPQLAIPANLHGNILKGKQINRQNVH